MGKNKKRKSKSNKSLHLRKSSSSSVIIIEEPAPDVISISSETTPIIHHGTSSSAAHQFCQQFHENWTRCTNTVDSRPCAQLAFDAFRVAFEHRYQTTKGAPAVWRSLTRQQRLAFHAEAFVAAAISRFSLERKMHDEEEIRRYFR